MNATWLEKLQWLVVRWSHIGVPNDLAGMDATELWGLYCLLSRLDDGA